MNQTSGVWDFKLGRAFAVLGSSASPEVKTVAVAVLREWVQAEIAEALRGAMLGGGR